MPTPLSTRYYKILARLLDGVILRSHARISHRHQRMIQPRLLELDSQTLDHLFPPPPPMPLDSIRGDLWENRARLWRRDFAFPSSAPSEHDHNRRVIVQTYAPDRGLHFPAVIALHGLLTPTLTGYRHIFRAIVEAGVSTYAVELPYHLRRTPPDFVSGELFFTADFAMNLRALQQAVADVRQLIQYLREAGAPVIGLLGFSLGAWISALVASCEPEVDFALFAMPPSNLNDLLWQTKLGEPLRKQFDSLGWSPADTAPFYQILDPVNLSLLIPPNRRELFAAEFDHFVPLSYTQKLQESWQQPHLRIYPSGHIGLLWSRKFLNDVRQIVSQQLTFGRRQETSVTVVTASELRALPQRLALQHSISPAPRLEVEK